MNALFTYWHLDFIMAVFLAGICFIYLFLTGFKIIKKSVYFFTGLLLILLSVASPLHFLGENYLMSAHMLSHVIILLIASPLLVAGIPKTSNKYILRFSETLVRFPWIPWMAGVCIMWFWHIPVIFNYLVETQSKFVVGSHLNSWYVLQNIHLISLVLCGIFFSWPLIGPGASRDSRIAALTAVLYLSTACIFCSILGLLITFAPLGVYTAYIHVGDHYGFLNMIRNDNGISVLVDQQVGGLIMWVPGCLIYLSASMYLLMKWFRQRNEPSTLSTQNSSHDRR